MSDTSIHQDQILEVAVIAEHTEINLWCPLCHKGRLSNGYILQSERIILNLLIFFNAIKNSFVSEFCLGAIFHKKLLMRLWLKYPQIYCANSMTADVFRHVFHSFWRSNVYPPLSSPSCSNPQRTLSIYFGKFL